MPKRVRITDHAYTRYFERILGYDLDEVRLWILGEKGHFPSDGLYPISKNGHRSHRVLIRNGKAITIIRPGEGLREAY